MWEKHRQNGMYTVKGSNDTTLKQQGGGSFADDRQTCRKGRYIKVYGGCDRLFAHKRPTATNKHRSNFHG